MPDVMCRPELHDATSREQYDQFHAGMQSLGLGRTIARDGREFQLPTGLYLGNVSSSLELLKLRVDLLAIRITSHTAKIALWPVNPADIVTDNLEDVTPSYASSLGFGLMSILGGAPYPNPSPNIFSTLFSEYRSSSQK
jgi:hypothetical protein